MADEDRRVEELTEVVILDGDDLFYLRRTSDDGDYKIKLSTLDSRFLVASNNLSDLTNAATARTNLGVAIGTNVQAWDAGLDDIAALTPTKGNLMAGNGANWQAIAVGTDAQVLVADSSEATGLKWAATSVSYAQVVIVAKSGGDYTTIQGAIDAITDATTTKRYAIKVEPGNYAEAVTMKDYVDIIGSGRTNSRITGTSGTVLTFPATKGTILDMGIYVDYGALGAASQAIVSAGADSVMIRCDIGVTKSSGDYVMNALYISAGAFRMSDCYFTYSITGATTDTQLTQSAVVQTGVLTTVILNNNEMTITSDDTNDDLVGFETTANVTGTALLANNVIAIDSGAAGSSATGLWLYGTASGMIANQNRLTINCNASAYGLWIDSTAGGATIDTRHNELIVTSVGAAQSANVAAGDTWNSVFDKITAASGYAGAGTITFVSSEVDGDMSITGGLTLGTDLALAHGGTAASTAADARTNLGLVAGGAGDIWVEKVGDTMTGALTITLDSTTPHLSLIRTTDAAREWRLEIDADADFGIRDSTGGVTPFQIFNGSQVNAFTIKSGYVVINDSGTNIDFRVEGDTDAQLLYTDAATDRVGISTSAPSSLLHTVQDNAVTAATTNVITLGHNSSGTPAANFGAGLLFQLESSTTADQDAASIAALWSTATHASRAADIIFNTVDNAGALTERVRIASAGDFTFNGDGSGLPFGSLCLHEGAVNIDISAVGQGVYVKITGLTTGELNNVTINSDAFNVGKVGRYLVNYSVSGDSAGVNKDYHCDIFVNGVEQSDGSSRRMFGAAGDLGNMGGSAILDITDTGHDIDLRMKEDGAGAGTDIDLYHVNFNIVMIGGS